MRRRRQGRRPSIRGRMQVSRTAPGIPPLDSSGGGFPFGERVRLKLQTTAAQQSRRDAAAIKFLHQMSNFLLDPQFSTLSPSATAEVLLNKNNQTHQPNSETKQSIYEKKNIHRYIVLSVCRAHGLRNGLRTTGQDTIWALSWSASARGGAGCSGGCHRAFL